ncbi:hypothetical protein [Natronococcus jeotgali]|uniref:Uncharacterized protein n=1 Tax=Natronococcus jeotgali DSM 18795 TaxID=1227498 RepID=L9WRW1_9EURY|nr:hypothetical protein [Natronococcus jeotgali]ELY52162.1 hypothetical protein C492_19901 [Natronococcus jeotgali DSM 18795]
MDPVRRYRLSMLVLGVCALVSGGVEIAREGWDGVGIGSALLVSGGAVVVIVSATGIEEPTPDVARRTGGLVGLGAALAAVGTVLSLL